MKPTGLITRPDRGPETYMGHSCFEPYGLECIAAALVDKGWDVRLSACPVADEREVAYVEVESQLLLFSSFTSDHHLAIEAAHKLKRDRPGSVAILGGHCASASRGAAACDPFDYVVVGEGEDAICELVEALSSSSLIGPTIPGVLARGSADNRFVARPRIHDLDRLPFSLRDDQTLQRSRVYGVTYPCPSTQTAVAQISYSRGCPSSCPYCASPQTWGQKVYWRSPAQVIREAHLLSEQHGANLLFFTDLTFNASERRVLALCDEFGSSGLDIAWFAMCGFTSTSPDTFRQMARRGCTKLGWGVEALTSTSLSKVKTRQSLARVKSLLDMADAVGIINRAYLMMGYPWQTHFDLECSLQLLAELPIDEVKVSFYTPFPGTPIYDEYRSQLQTSDFSQFDTDHPVLDSSDMKAAELTDERRWFYAQFYCSQAYDKRRKDKIRRFPHFKRSYEEMSAFLHAYGIVQ